MSKGWNKADTAEDKAARTVARMAGVSVARILRQSDLSVSGKLTFAMLRELAEFPGRPLVSACVIDTPDSILMRFEKSDLRKAWIRLWEENVHHSSGRRAMIANGLSWGHMVLTDQQPPDPPYICLASKEKLYLLPLKAWVTHLRWATDLSEDWSENSRRDTDD